MAAQGVHSIGAKNIKNRKEHIATICNMRNMYSTQSNPSPTFLIDTLLFQQHLSASRRRDKYPSSWGCSPLGNIFYFQILWSAEKFCRTCWNVSTRSDFVQLGYPLRITHEANPESTVNGRHRWQKCLAKCGLTKLNKKCTLPLLVDTCRIM